MDWTTVGIITIPFFSGALGWVTNWTGVWMIFHPLEFRGIRVPGLAALARFLPRRVQQVPGVMHGGVGWQGIVPSRAAKMGAIAVDKGIAKIGSPSDFYSELEPDELADHIVDKARGYAADAVDRTIAREDPQFWNDLPPRVRERLHERVQEELPDIIHSIADDIGDNIDQLLDIKMMVIRLVETRPEIANRVFSAVSTKELRFMVRFGFWFGFLLGIPLAFLMHAVESPWVLLAGGVVTGWTTNWLGITIIFQPLEEKRIGPFHFRGKFLQRRDEVAEIYAGIISREVITLENIGDELIHGPNSDKTRQLIEAAMRPAVDRAVGRLRPVVQVALGTQEYESVRESFARESVDYTMTPFRDPEFNSDRGEIISRLVCREIKRLSNQDYIELLRSAIRQDEWLLILHGAVLGVATHGLHLLIFPA